MNTTHRQRSPRAAFVENVASGVGARVAGMLAMLIVTPAVVARLGLADYGFWALLQGAVQYLQIADGGFPSAAIALVGRSRSQLEARRAVSTVTLVMIPVAFTFVGLSAAAALMVPSDLADTLPTDWQVAVICAALAVAGLMIGNSFGAGVAGSERWDLHSRNMVAGQLCTAGLTGASVAAGGGLAFVAAALAIGTVLTCVLHAISARRLGVLDPFLRGFDRPMFRVLRDQGANMQIITFSGVTTTQADRYMLLPFGSLDLVAYYDLGAKVAVAVKALPLATMGPLISSLAKSYGSGGISGTELTYARATRLLAIYAVPGLILLYGAAFPATLAWLGTDYRTSAGIALLVGLGYALNFMTGAATAVARAGGRAALDRNYAIAILVGNVALSVALGLALGPWGVIAATPISLLLPSIWLLRATDEWLGSTASQELASSWKVRARIGSTLIAAIGTAAMSVFIAAHTSARIPQLILAVAVVFVGLSLIAGKRGRSSLSELRTKVPFPRP